MKYKVGDRVRIVSNFASKYWNETAQKWQGEIMTVKSLDEEHNFYKMAEDIGESWTGEGWRWYDCDIAGLADEPKNLMPNVLALFKRLYDIDKDEEFEIVGASSNPHKLTENGLTAVKGKSNCTLSALLRGDLTIKKLPWKPRQGDTYHYVANDGFIWDKTFEVTLDRAMYLIGNCFRTREEAEANKEQVKECLELDEWVR